jgi:hypothetical protein
MRLRGSPRRAKPAWALAHRPEASQTTSAILIDPAPQHTPEDLGRLCQSQGTIGSLVLLVNGVEVEVAV